MKDYSSFVPPICKIQGTHRASFAQAPFWIANPVGNLVWGLVKQNVFKRHPGWSSNLPFVHVETAAVIVCVYVFEGNRHSPGFHFSWFGIVMLLRDHLMWLEAPLLQVLHELRGPRRECDLARGDDADETRTAVAEG